MHPVVPLNFGRRVWRNRYTIRSLVARDLRARYVGSFLGLFWSVIHPLVQLGLYYWIFSIVLQARLAPEYAQTPYALWLMAGLLPWMLFAEVVTRAPNAVLDQTALVTQMVFPSEILPLVHLASAFINHLIGVALLLSLCGILGFPAGPGLLWLIPYAVGIALLALGLAWLLAALNVFLRDVGQVVGVLVNVWFFLTPVLYSRHLLAGRFERVLDLNPMLHAIEGYRAALLGQTVETHSYALAYLAGTGLLFCAAGGLLFRKLKPAFADVL